MSKADKNEGGEEKLSMRKSPPLKQKERKQRETGVGFKQCWRTAAADSSLWSNEMIIRATTGGSGQALWLSCWE